MKKEKIHFLFAVSTKRYKHLSGIDWKNKYDLLKRRKKGEKENEKKKETQKC